MREKSHFFGGIFLFMLVIGFTFWIGLQPVMCGRDSGRKQIIAEQSGFLPDYRMSYQCWGKMEQVTGIILHYTDTDTVPKAIQAMKNRDLFVQLIIDKDGSVYQVTDNIDDFSAGATGGNAWGINIEIVGNRYSLMQSALANDEQFASVVTTVRYLSKEFDIPIMNELPSKDVLNWSGIFSHEQVDTFHPKGGRNNKIDPGKEYMGFVMAALKE